MKFRKMFNALCISAVVLMVSVGNVYASWDYSQAANSQCETNNEISIWVRFTNAEILNSGHTLHVVATDEQSGASVDMGDILAKDTADKTIYTGVAANANGVIRFDITPVGGWANGTEKAYATYSGKSCGNGSITPSATPVATPTATPGNGGGCTSNCGGNSTPTPTSTPEAGSSATKRTDLSDNRSDNLGCSVNDCSGNVVGRYGVVAGVSTESSSNGVLPSTGADLWFSIVGAGYLGVFGYGLRRIASKME